MTAVEMVLAGCSPRPLAGYLKALAIHRLVAEQVDPTARGWWTPGGFALRSSLDLAGLGRFLAESYQPTPVVSPWNGGSGFWPKDNQDGIGPIGQATSGRFAAYAASIAVGRAVVARATASGREDDKAWVLATMRAELPDAALAWLDAAVVLTSEGPAYPPLLGTGGNDGRLDFSNNFMQRLVEITSAKPPQLTAWLAASLEGRAVPRLAGGAIGQFLPAQAGGFNTGFGFDGSSRVNPVDFILLVEGALAFAATAVRKLEGAGRDGLAFPFMVRAAGAGYASAADADVTDGRHELWLPVWTRPATWPELRQLLGEGRALVAGPSGRRAAVSAIDFARSVAEFGIDRGISSFERVGFHCRNGLSYLAVPLGRWPVPARAGGSALVELDRWIERFRSAAGGGSAPARFVRFRRELDEAVLATCREDTPESREHLLRLLGRIELALARSPGFGEKQQLPPVPYLGADWLPPASLASPERRLALALAGAGLRQRFAPVSELRSGRGDLVRLEIGPGAVWRGVSLVGDLAALAIRVDVEREAREETADLGVGADLADVAAFVACETDDERLAELAIGYSLLRPGLWPVWPRASGSLPLGVAILALCVDPRPVPWGGAAGDAALPRTPGLARLAATGRATEAGSRALRRLLASGLVPRSHAHRHGAARFVPVVATPVESRRWAAALAFPLSQAARQRLAAQVLVPPTQSEE